MAKKKHDFVRKEISNESNLYERAHKIERGNFDPLVLRMIDTVKQWLRVGIPQCHNQSFSKETRNGILDHWSEELKEVEVLLYGKIKLNDSKFFRELADALDHRAARERPDGTVGIAEENKIPYWLATFYADVDGKVTKGELIRRVLAGPCPCPTDTNEVDYKRHLSRVCDDLELHFEPGKPGRRTAAQRAEIYQPNPAELFLKRLFYRMPEALDDREAALKKAKENPQK